MTRRLTTTIATVAVAGIAAGAAGTISAASGSAPTAKPTAYGAATRAVSTRHTKLGTIIVDSKGRTLYLFEKDKTTKSNCYGACASLWPPAAASGKPKAGSGVKQSKLGVTTRKGGGRQLTYGGHPLYRYSADRKAGQTSGEGLNAYGAYWYVVAPSGKKIDDD
jgi:predicted lipoprotein with Yx(FWY)xxD motif